jgi:hypothetical protein
MKTIVTTAIIALSFAVASVASAEGLVSDPVLVDLAQGGNNLSSHGIWTGR